jgi:putative ABC transport system permease protein
MALGLYITFRVLEFSDLTVDGSFAAGGAVTVVLILRGFNPWLAVLAAVITGMLCGLVTGFLHTRLGIAPILSGILTQIGLYSVNLHVLGNKANQAVSVDKYPLLLTLRQPGTAILVAGVFALAIIGFFYWFFGTELGSAVRATGCNPNMSRAQGIDIDRMKVLALAVANGTVALSGGLMAQYQGFADVGMGRGAIVIGLAAIIIGEVVQRIFTKESLNFAVLLGFVIVGGILYYVIMGVALWLRLPTNDLKLFTAIIVALALALPNLRQKGYGAAKKSEKKEAANHG